MGFILRLLFAFALLCATYNPTPYNFVQWAARDFDTQMPQIVLAGLLLFIGYIIYLRATLRSIGLFGMLLILAVIAALLWVLYDWGLLSLDNPQTNTWLGLVALAFVLGIGLSWSIVRRALSGQADVDDVEE